MSSNDPKSLSRPYLAAGMDYLKQYAWRTFQDAQGGADDAEYSELFKPYLYDNDTPNDYSFWEFIWPNPEWPNIPTVTYPDLGDCETDEDCEFAKIVGSEQMQCGQCQTYSQYHQWIGCDIAPMFAAFGSWVLEPEGDCYLLFSGPVMATVCCNEGVGGVYTLCYYGPLNCVDCIQITVTCEGDSCCAGVALSGADTVAPGGTWTGTIAPACPGINCTVSSNSGCRLNCNVNAAGSAVTVVTQADDCGGFTVTIEDDCEENNSSKFVRITGGAWSYDVNSSTLGLNGCAGCGCGGSLQNVGPHCFIGQYKYGGFEVDPAKYCEGLAQSQCQGTGSSPCTACGGADGTNICGWPSLGCGPPLADCERWHWWRCKYTCDC